MKKKYLQCFRNDILWERDEDQDDSDPQLFSTKCHTIENIE